jgi:hypothetical protein
MKILAACFLSVLLFAGVALAADVTGTWTANVELAAGGGSPKLELKQSGETLTGTYHGQFGEAAIKGTVKGNKVEFSFGTDAAQAKYSGTLESDKKMSGTVDYGEVGTGTFTATKD